MRALVTGGAGFIGSHVVDHLINRGHEVAVIDDLSGGFRENINPEARFYNVSITDPTWVDHIFEACRFDHVYHLAAYAAEGLSHFIRSFNYTNNVVGSVNLINASIKHKIKCFVFTSSIAVYGHSKPPMHEHDTPQPADPYGIAKYAVELDLEAARKQFGLPYIIFRPHNVYGERQNIGDPYRNVIGIWMNQIMNDKPCTIFGDGNQTRAFTHIDDVAPVIARAPFEPMAYNLIFNIGASMPCSVNWLYGLVSAAMGKHTGKVHLPARNEVIDAFSDHELVKAVFGAYPRITLTEGLTRMAKWVKEVGPRSSQPYRNIEVEEGLPPSWTQAREEALL